MTDDDVIDGGQNTLLSLFAVIVVESSLAADEPGRIVYANDLFAALSGWTAHELTNQPLDMVIPEQSRKAHHYYRAGFMERPSARPMGPDREVVLLHKDGHEIRVWVGLAPVDDHNVTAVVMPMDIGRSYGLSRRGEDGLA